MVGGTERSGNSKAFGVAGLVLAAMEMGGADFLCRASPAAEPTVVDAWTSVKAPAAPELKAVRLERAGTVLLVLDIEPRTVDPKRRPRAVASVPTLKKLVEKARAAGVPVVYSTTKNSTPADILPEVAPRPGEPVVRSSVDKFRSTNLEELLKERGAKRVIVVGTAAEGAVLYTASAAALRGLEVIVPVDGISSSELYAEQYVCWHLLNAPGVVGLVTLTKVDGIEIAP